MYSVWLVFQCGFYMWAIDQRINSMNHLKDITLTLPGSFSSFGTFREVWPFEIHYNFCPSNTATVLVVPLSLLILLIIDIVIIKSSLVNRSFFNLFVVLEAVIIAGSCACPLGCFKHGQLDPQLASQLDPNSNPNLIRVGVQVGVSCLNAKLCGTILISTPPQLRLPN